MTAVEQFRPGAGLRMIASAVDTYKRVFTEGKSAQLLSRAQPVRHTGYDFELAVMGIEAEADEVLSLTLCDPDGADLPAWTPGAHIDVFLPSGRQRQYSLNSDPDDRSSYRIAVRYIADGDGGSREIHEGLRVGDRLRVRGPRNAFPLITAPEYFFVAGGIGITAILPMVTAAERAGIPWRLMYFGRSRTRMPFLYELARFTGGDVVVRPDDEYGVPDPRMIFEQTPTGAAVYVCGPPPLAEGARKVLSLHDPTASLHTERFSAVPVRDGAAFRIRLRRSGTEVDVAADESALAAIKRAVPGVPYSCQQGFCGACRAGVLSGEVDHQDRALLPSERDGAMLTCVSRARGGELELDL
ncbi:PDR/VanB family oxidoreductase [Nocardia sp. NBC_00565]|uniref:PDR/VanB family oxidoreductase n=1 Tax=Nocardia sp. NBC_00565 TaxID=2975993 RepID=UPI002E823C51|nr:PDR/VanB family oxidoreductase [Nocardia sp. NBC_00565]WUC05336.1 PDR/VanB family oxidoreductase [Nocardia sp. NBC_00565]